MVLPAAELHIMARLLTQADMSTLVLQVELHSLQSFCQQPMPEPKHCAMHVFDCMTLVGAFKQHQ